MTKDDLIILKNGLSQFYGAIPELLDRVKHLKMGGYTEDYVRKVLKGERRNPNILVAAQELLIELKTQEKEIDSVIRLNSKRIKELTA